MYFSFIVNDVIILGVLKVENLNFVIQKLWI